MRVIAGTAKRLQLKTLPGLETRPTTDRIKETLFNMINHELCDCRFLDLFSGSGGIGIEALSRGAKKCVFIEKNQHAIKCIEENLRFTKLMPNAQVLRSDVLSGLHLLNEQEPFDFIFMDPPYEQGLEKQVLEKLISSNLINEDTIIIIEAALNTEFDYLSQMGYLVVKCKKYKTNIHMFAKKE
jgi:RNA methyltransferase, RsmD family